MAVKLYLDDPYLPPSKRNKTTFKKDSGKMAWHGGFIWDKNRQKRPTSILTIVFAAFRKCNWTTKKRK